MKTSISGFLVVSICAAIFCLAQPGWAATDLIPLYTPPAGGSAYTLGAAMASVVNKYMSDCRFIPEASAGSMDMIRHLMQRTAQKKDCLAAPGLQDAARAYRGEGEYGGRPFPQIRGVIFFNDSDLYLVVPKRSPIKSYADARGKHLGLNPAGSTTANTALFLLEQHGIKKTDFKPHYCTFRETLDGIQDGSLDGGFLAGGYPNSAYMELATNHEVRIVPVDEKILDKAARDHVYYYRSVVKAKSYKGLDQDVPIMGWTTGIVTHAGMSTDRVYRFVKALLEHKDEYYAIHKSARDMTPETVTKGFAIPMHPGAEKYYKEVGIWKH